MIPIEVTEMHVDLTTIKDSTKNCSNSDLSYANSFVKNGGYIVRSDASSPKPSGQLRRTTKESVTFVGNTRQQQALNKAISSAATFDQCCYVEWYADFHPVHYMKALEELLGKGSV
ncbi:hypothetical protein LAZ67_3001245 [Cordylochernes scorpioides]|uniref:Uncharacterized protein n=1 Tax=Cordylochernes scorpioides TaxID=51811 RepID=A0ABY6K7M1_9ARAC|nr:hypothetical protein LAZ67_3001245 [Cordylochernes scorpioides]